MTFAGAAVLPLIIVLITGFAVFILTVTLGIFMIKKANKKFKERKNTNE